MIITAELGSMGEMSYSQGTLGESDGWRRGMPCRGKMKVAVIRDKVSRQHYNIGFLER